MCGRAAQHSDIDQIARQFGLVPSAPRPASTSRWNAGPRQSLVTIKYDVTADGPVAEVMRWGLIPSWATDAAIGDKAINARCEGVAEKPMFREAWRARRRCIVPVDAFYEWKSTGRTKQPWAFAAADGAMLGLAGLWESWRGANGPEIRSFSIVTTAASLWMAAMHDRMPAIIAPSNYDIWLTGSADQAKGLLKMRVDFELQMWPVSTAMNRVGGLEGPECLAIVESQERLI